jgi:hypothetical protein
MCDEVQLSHWEAKTGVECEKIRDSVHLRRNAPPNQERTK